MQPCPKRKVRALTSSQSAPLKGLKRPIILCCCLQCFLTTSQMKGIEPSGFQTSDLTNPCSRAAASAQLSSITSFVCFTVCTYLVLCLSTMSPCHISAPSVPPPPPPTFLPLPLCPSLPGCLQPRGLTSWPGCRICQHIFSSLAVRNVRHRL